MKEGDQEEGEEEAARHAACRFDDVDPGDGLPLFLGREEEPAGEGEDGADEISDGEDEEKSAGRDFDEGDELSGGDVEKGAGRPYERDRQGEVLPLMRPDVVSGSACC